MWYEWWPLATHDLRADTRHVSSRTGVSNNTAHPTYQEFVLCASLAEQATVSPQSHRWQQHAPALGLG